MNVTRFLVPVVVAGMFVSTSASAAVISYTTRASFNSAVGATSSETFNSIGTDESFLTSAVTVGAITLSNSGTPSFNGPRTQKIDAPTFEFSGLYDIDDTTYVLADLETNTLTIGFAGGITAFGADFRGVSNAPRSESIGIFDASDTLLGSVVVPGTTDSALSFFGFSLPGGLMADHIVFSNSDGVNADNDAFGIDNVAFRSAATTVPEPDTLALAGIALFGLGMARRRRA